MLLNRPPDGAERDHEGEHHRDVDAVAEVREGGAAKVLEDRLQVLRDEEGVDGHAAHLANKQSSTLELKQGGKPT